MARCWLPDCGLPITYKVNGKGVRVPYDVPLPDPPTHFQNPKHIKAMKAQRKLNGRAPVDELASLASLVQFFGLTSAQARAILKEHGTWEAATLALLAERGKA